MVAMVIYLSLTPHPPVLLSFNNADKLEHACAYAGLSFWFCQLHARFRTMLAIIGLGIGMEYMQRWTGYRTFDVFDMLADAAGVVLGWLLVLTPLGRTLSVIEQTLKRKHRV